MFTGIINSIGTIKEVIHNQNGMSLVLSCLLNNVQLGSSVAVDGVCLTVNKIDKDLLFFDVMAETIKKTTLHTVEVGDKVHVEPALRVGDEIGGHFVYGHVDAVSEVESIAKDGENNLLTIQIPSELRKYIAPQGAITIDGVSLTVASSTENTATVSLVQYTWEHTNFSKAKKGDSLNIETDMLAKYVLNNK
jgi:riboflavin synthase